MSRVDTLRVVTANNRSSSRRRWMVVLGLVIVAVGGAIVISQLLAWNARGRAAVDQKIATDAEAFVERFLTALPVNDPLRERFGAFHGLSGMKSTRPRTTFEYVDGVEIGGTAMFEAGAMPIMIIVSAEGPLDTPAINIYPDDTWMTQHPTAKETRATRGLQVMHEGGLAYTEMLINMRHPDFKPRRRGWSLLRSD